MSKLDLSNDLAAALEIAALAGKLVRDEYQTFAAIPDAPVDISTHVDKASQELILTRLHDRFPTDALCGEETTPTLQSVAQTGPRAWVIDPIDGTRGFARKTGQFSVMIGLLVEGRPVLGVVMEPALDRYTFAALGGGCWWKVGDQAPVACRVSNRATTGESVLTQSWAKPGQTSRPVQAVGPAKVIETYSGGVKLALVARGEADVYANTYERFADWDVCAGHILVTEAGGRVTDLSGADIRYQGTGFVQERGLLATNGPLHDEVLKRLQGA